MHVQSSELETAPGNGDDPIPRRRIARHQFSKEILADLKQLRTPSTFAAAKAISEDLFWIASGAAAVLGGLAQGGLIGFAAMLVGLTVIGARQRGFATLLHESSHNSLSFIRWLNFLMGAIPAWAIMQRHSRYVESHVSGHHRWLGDPSRDPDTAQYVAQKLVDQNPDTFFFKNMIELLIGMKGLKTLPYLLRDRFLPARGTRLSRNEIAELAAMILFWLTVLSTIGINGWWIEFLLVWVVPYFTSFQAIGWLIETAEHAPLIWSEPDSFTWTRNRKGNRFERFFTGLHGESYHRVHHLFPWIPFHRMQEAHEILMRDEDYAAFEAKSGGMFTRGINGAPTILNSIASEIRGLQTRTLGDA